MQYPQQRSLLLNKSADATPEDVAEWERTDYFRKGDFDVMTMFVVIPALIQLLTVMAMFGVFWLNSQIFT